MCITRDRELQTIFLYQNNYINKLINKFNVSMLSKLFKVSLSNFTLIKKNEKKRTSQKVHVYYQNLRLELDRFSRSQVLIRRTLSKNQLNQVRDLIVYLTT